jgi:hypothetical protein
MRPSRKVILCAVYLLIVSVGAVWMSTAPAGSGAAGVVCKTGQVPPVSTLDVVKRLYHLTVLRERRVVWSISLIKAVLAAAVILITMHGWRRAITEHSKDMVIIMAVTFAAIEIPRRYVAMHELAEHGINAGYVYSIMMQRHAAAAAGGSESHLPRGVAKTSGSADETVAESAGVD